MKKFLSLLLVLLLIPGAFLFTACKEDDGYKLSNLQKDLLNIAEQHDIVVKVDDKLQFDYSSLKVAGQDILAEAVENVEPYKNLNLYNEVFYNLMEFTYDYVDVCSNDNYKLDAEYRNNIKAKLDEFNSNIDVVEIQVKNLANIMNEESDLTNEIYLSRLDNVMVAYNKLYNAGANLNNAISDLYFNKILYKSNPNISSISLKDFNSAIVINNLDARTKNALSLLTQNFIESYVSDGDLPETLLTKTESGFGTLDLTKFSYSTFVSRLRLVKLDTAESVEKAVEVANNEENKAAFYEKAIQVYNLQEMVQNDRVTYIKACADIDYQETKDNNKASSYEKICARIIENYIYITNNYCTDLGALLAIINV